MAYLKKYYLFLCLILSTIILYTIYKNNTSLNPENTVEELSSTLIEQQNKLEKYLDFTEKEIYLHGLKKLKRTDKKTDFYLHLYRNESLIYWNTNQLPILRFADIHYPSEGIVHLQNGWYYAKIKEVDGISICASFLIKHDFPYNNNNLQNTFADNFNFHYNALLTLDMEDGIQVLDSQKNYLFSVADIENLPLNNIQSFWVLMAFLLPIFFLGCILFQFVANKNLKIQWLTIVIIVTLRMILLYFSWTSMFDFSIAFSPQLYGASLFSPNLAEFILHVLLITWITLVFVKGLKRKLYKFNNYLILFILILIAYFGWTAILITNSGLIEHSDIPLSINRLFNLNAFSIIAIFSLGLLLYTYFLLLFSCCKILHKQHFSGSRLAVLIFILGIVYFFVELHYGFQIPAAAIFPSLILGILSYQFYRQKSNSLYGLGIIYLVFFAFVLAKNMSEFNTRKEIEERIVYANQLSTDQDILTEVEFTKLKTRIDADNFLSKIVANPTTIGQREFQEGLERRVFDNYWERYEMDFFLFDSLGKSILDLPIDQRNNLFEFENIITRHGIVSEVDEEIYHIQDNIDNYTYISNHLITTKYGANGRLIITFKSKKLPEEIGFPQLLISDEAKTLNSLQNYSIARYFNKKLILNYGNFNFPTSIQKFWNKNDSKVGFVNIEGYNHYIFQKSEREFLIISAKNITRIDLLTSFSYIFCFFGIILLPFLIRTNNRKSFTNLTLAIKIQLALVALIFLALLGFGFGSGIFIKNQYNNYTHDVISEKLHSVKMELETKIKSLDVKDINDKGNYLQYWLQKFSRVFIVDINFYNVNGYMVSTSRPKIFNMGLISEQINPTAFKNLALKKRSEFIHEENIGSLYYSSAYIPFFNDNEELIGYVNLQHFGQQKEFENQIQQFLVAIINVFMLLLAISVIAALFVSNWVTAPLRFLQESFAKLSLGKENQMIDYEKNDEIGALVKEYNQKIQELEYAANQLAQSERESAWREMAKQVAHEIKNPLTPMKLSIQQLQRVYDPNDPNSREKLQKVSQSVIEQIDALTKIANEFSNFAKMPKSTEEIIDLLPLIEGLI